MAVTENSYENRIIRLKSSLEIMMSAKKNSLQKMASYRRFHIVRPITLFNIHVKDQSVLKPNSTGNALHRR